MDLYVEAEENNVAVLHHILFAFGADQTLFLGSSDGTVGNQVLKGDDLCTDEAALKVAVNFAGSLRCFGAAW